jgi:hypothetical protein
MYSFKLKPTEIRPSSDFLNHLVAAYRDGLPNSAEALIEAFEPLLYKYYRLLYDGRWDVNDSDLAHFLKMMSLSGDLDAAARSISASMQRMYEPEDIRQELVLVLLLTAQKYNNISRTLKFELKRRLQGTDEEEGLLKEAPIYDRIDPDLEGTLPFIESGAIDMAWVKGISTGPGWDQLSTIQRAIIKYIYADGLAPDIAAKKLKMSRRQLERYNKKAKEILAEYFVDGD